MADSFNERLEELQSIDRVVLARVYDKTSKELLSIVPNLPGKSGSLKNFYGNTDYNSKGLNLPKILKVFGEELVNEAIDDKHPNIQLIKSAINKGRELTVNYVYSQELNLLEDITGGNATDEQKLEGLNLLQSGELRTAEKTYGFEGNKPFWEPQAYSIAVLNSGFKLFDMGTFPGNSEYVDMIPLWSQDVNLEEGVHSPFMSEKKLIERKVRLIPGSFSRSWSYIGPSTVLMPGSIANIGSHIEGYDTMLDGGARVGSGAQICRTVKIGGGSGIEGVLEPAGIIPTIVEDNVKIGAQCEVTGIVGKGSILGNNTVMASGKKIYDEREGEFIESLYVKTEKGVVAIPHIPEDRIAVGGTYTKKGSEIGSDIIRLLKKPASESDFMKLPQNSILYQR